MSPASSHSIVSALTIPERAALVNGADTWSTTAVDRLGLGSVLMSDGPSGVRGAAWDERNTAVSFPCGVALGATFDAELLHEVGVALGEQARERGVDVLLGPTINLQRAPHAGRHFEYFSEDPYLTALLAVAYVRGLQSRGVGASPKHFVANDSETQRHTVDVRAARAVLRETSLLPFEAAVRDAGTWTIMAAYNFVDGVPMTANTDLLGAVLRDEWGFDGVALSDWGAVYDTERSAAGPLDLAMPGPNGNWGAPLRDALADGRVDPRVLDAKVRNLVRLAERTGRVAGVERSGVTATASIDASTVARRAAAASITLLRNTDAALPLPPAELRRVAVIGPNAVRPVTQGGGSAHVNAAHRPGPVESLQAALGEGVEVVSAPGCDTRIRVPALGTDVTTVDPVTGEPGVGVEYCDAEGVVLLREVRAGGQLVWFGALPGDLDPTVVETIAVHARVDVSAADRFEIGIAAMSSQVLSIDGEVALDADRTAIVGSDLFHSPAESRLVVSTGERSTIDLVVRQPLYERRELAVCFIGMQPADVDADQLLEQAVELARTAEAAVVVVGTNAEVESEGFDRTTLALPGRQDELIARVSAVNPRTIVVVNAGAPVLMPWLDQVQAVVVSWFGGEWAGSALADVLTGASEPLGRLPFTWPASESASFLRSTTPIDGRLHYGTTVEVANRRADASGVLFPFGAGLGYTSWLVQSAVTTPESVAAPVTFGGDRVHAVEVTMRNAGERAGSTLVQLVARFEEDSVHRGQRAVVAAQRVHGGPGEDVRVTVPIPHRLLQRWDDELGVWVDRELRGLDVVSDVETVLATVSGQLA
jgi:beta-glucosidase